MSSVITSKELLILNEKVFIRKILDRVVDDKNAWWFTFDDDKRPGHKIFQIKIMDNMNTDTLFFIEYERKSPYVYRKLPFFATVLCPSEDNPYLNDERHRFADYMKWYWYIRQARLPERFGRMLNKTWRSV